MQVSTYKDNQRHHLEFARLQQSAIAARRGRGVAVWTSAYRVLVEPSKFSGKDGNRRP